MSNLLSLPWDTILRYSEGTPPETCIYSLHINKAFLVGCTLQHLGDDAHNLLPVTSLLFHYSMDVTYVRIVSRPVSCVVVSYRSKSNLLNNIKLKSEVCECACQYFRKPFSPFRQHYYSFCLNDPSDPFFPIRSISPHPTPFPLPRSPPLHPRCFPIPPRALRRVVGILGNYPSLPPSSADPFCLSPFFIIHPLLPSSPP